MAAPTVSITLATREDVPEILAMIHELAAYEKASDSVLATEELLVRTLSFAPSAQPTNPGYAQTLILRVPATEATSTADDHTEKSSSTSKNLTPVPSRDQPPHLHAGLVVAGMALFFHNYSTWRARPGIYLEDLFVRPAFRGKGYGTRLLQRLALEVLRIDGGRLEWSCLRWNEPSLRFYRGLGATEMEDWVGLRVDGPALEKLARAAAEAEAEAVAQGGA